MFTSSAFTNSVVKHYQEQRKNELFVYLPIKISSLYPARSTTQVSEETGNQEDYSYMFKVQDQDQWRCCALWRSQWVNGTSYHNGCTCPGQGQDRLGVEGEMQLSSTWSIERRTDLALVTSFQLNKTSRGVSVGYLSWIKFRDRTAAGRSISV